MRTGASGAPTSGSPAAPGRCRPGRAPSWGCEAAVEVVEVVPESPADRAGLRPEDLIVELDGAQIGDVNVLQRLMVAELIGQRVPISVVRGSRVVELELEPAELGARQG